VNSQEGELFFCDLGGGTDGEPVQLSLLLASGEGEQRQIPAGRGNTAHEPYAQVRKSNDFTRVYWNT
jgi:hypothetical protein